MTKRKTWPPLYAFLNRIERESTNISKLYDDIGSFRSVIKKATQEAILSGYALYAPPSANSQTARTTAVKDKASALLHDSAYLRGEPDKGVRDSCRLIASHTTHDISRERHLTSAMSS